MKKLTDALLIACYTLLFALFPLVISRIVRLYYIIRYKDGRQRHKEWYLEKQADYCRFFLCKSLLGVKVVLLNDQNESFEQPAIIIANHQSMLDIPAILMLHPRIVGMAKEELFHQCLFSQMVKCKELISNSAPIRTVANYVREKMSSGFSFFIFPEGTRSRDLSILPFRQGAFFLAETLKCDIIPVTIWGAGKIFPASGEVGRGTIVVEIGERRVYDGMNRAQMAQYWHDYFVEHFESLNIKYK